MYLHIYCRYMYLKKSLILQIVLHEFQIMITLSDAKSWLLQGRRCRSFLQLSFVFDPPGLELTVVSGRSFNTKLHNKTYKTLDFITILWSLNQLKENDANVWAHNLVKHSSRSHTCVPEFRFVSEFRLRFVLFISTDSGCLASFNYSSPVFLNGNALVEYWFLIKAKTCPPI